MNETPDIYLHLDGQQSGPFPLAQVRQMLTEGKLFAETPVWYKGLSDWTTLDKVLASFPAEGTLPPPFVPSQVPPPAPAKKGMSGCLLAAIIVGVAAVCGLPVIAILAGIALGPITLGIEKAKENASMQEARAIGLMMFQYSLDHNGAYPDGKTSTEVFQKLIDEKYVTDPGIFYISMPGKTRATSNTLTADNVCFDVTSGVATDSPDDLPVVFLTGFTVTYTAGTSATRDPGSQMPLKGMAVDYKNNMASVKKIYPDGTVPDFIPASFDPGTKTYEQLRP